MDNTNNYNNPLATATGNLIVRVTEVNSSVPLSDALVIVTKDERILHGIMITDNSGKTPSLALPAPPASQSLKPSLELPYETYYVQIYKSGYYVEDNHMVQIFGNSESSLEINLIPLPEYPDKDVIVY